MIWKERPSGGGVSVRFVIFAAALVLLAGALGAWLGVVTGAGRNIAGIWTPPFGGKRVVRILMMGEDDSGIRSRTTGLSDSIVLVSVNLDTRQIAGLSIPRDTRVDLNGYGGVSKINAALKIGGPSLTEHAVEGLTGIRPDYYIKTDLKGFRKTVDLLGGVDLVVEKDMHYDDNWGNLHIHLKKGFRHLNGEQAMGYVRFRHDKLGDITRMQRQQNFLRALAKKALAPSNLPRLPRIISSVMSNVQTNLMPKDLIELAKLAGDSEATPDQIKTAVLPAYPERIGGSSYMIPDTEKIPELIQELFFSTVIPGMPRVEVLNGSGITGAGQRVAEALKQQGYPVVYVGNADSFDYSQSRVIGNREDLPGLDNIGRIVNSSDISSARNPAARADVTVIVGRDCALAPSQG